MTAAIVASDVRVTRGDINVYAGLVDPLAAGGNAQLNGGSVLAVNDGAITVNQGGSSLTFTGAAAEIINGKDTTGNAGMSAPQGSSGKEFSGWQTGDGIYLSAGAGNITLADGSSLRGDRIYYIIRRAAPDGKTIIQLADTQEERAARQALAFGAVSNIAGIRFAHVRMQEATRVNLQPYHGADATVGVDSANNRLVVNARSMACRKARPSSTAVRWPMARSRTCWPTASCARARTCSRSVLHTTWSIWTGPSTARCRSSCATARAIW